MVLAVIPARWASSRFPGKPLAKIGDTTMIHRVCDQVARATKVDRIVVATDDERIFSHVESFGVAVQMTRADHPSGTDRCAEVAKNWPEATMVVNIQGDEPFIHPGQIDLLVETLISRPELHIATLAKRIQRIEAVHEPSVVKVVFSTLREALYFSRNPIPFVRDQPSADWLNFAQFHKHIGMYAFRADVLQQISKLSPTLLENAEKLEQLRWLENGLRIAIGLTDMETIGVDTPEDLERANAALGV